ncbi:MAG: prepilin-type N-terminal cleavage/methylation domain-containing protein [Gemmatimonadetes bacterium]|nr:prepilin-type N-terminal cleavage/methylation domain-containing protein [Gemmatimonadota bacterium]
MSARITPADGHSGGFTLIEVVMAIMILTYGMLGMAGVTLHVVRQVQIAEMDTDRSAVLQSVIERVRAESFDTYQTGSDTAGAYTVEWQTWAENSRAKGLRVVTTGPGLVSNGGPVMIAADATDTVEYRLVRR